MAVYIPPQCEIKAEPSMKETRTLFMFFLIVWVLMHFCNLCRSGGMVLYRDNAYMLVVLAFASLAFVLWPLTNPNHPCEGPVATCSTISCVCGNLIWQGYVWMFVVIALNAFIFLKALAYNLNTYLTKLPHRDKRESRVEQCSWGTCILFIALLITTITGIFPSLKRDPQDEDENLKRSLDFGHTIGIALGGLLGGVGLIWCKLHTLCFYKTVINQLKTDKEQANLANADDQDVRILEYKTMLVRRNREYSFLAFDASALVLTFVFAIMFAVNNHQVPQIHDSHLCSKWVTENDCHGDSTNSSDVGLGPWVCVWVDKSASGQAVRQAHFANTNDCAYGCCFSNAVCYDNALYPDIANYFNQTKPNDRGKCRASQNARVMVLEFLLLVYLLLNLANHLSGKVHDDVFLEITEGGPLAANFNNDEHNFQWWWIVNPCSSKYIVRFWGTIATNTTFSKWAELLENVRLQNFVRTLVKNLLLDELRPQTEAAQAELTAYAVTTLANTNTALTAHAETTLNTTNTKLTALAETTLLALANTVSTSRSPGTKLPANYQESNL